MRLERIEFTDFRNLGGAIEPGEGVNLLVGRNGQGKTNALEGIWLLSGQKSFCTQKDSFMVKFGEQKAEIKAAFNGSGRDFSVKLSIAGRRSAEINGIHAERTAKLAEIFHCVIFSPQNIRMVSDGPETRRAFVDSAVFSAKPAYGATMREYDSVLFGRNRVLKELGRGYSGENADLLEAYSVRLATVGARIAAARARYCARLAQAAPQIYEPLSGGEKLGVEYKFSVAESENGYREALYRAMRNNADEEIGCGFSCYGPHREDIEITVDGRPARLFASQGQKKSAALCLKLAEGEILAGAAGERPIYLLDDVMSELDRDRQHYVLNSLRGQQMFITCCEPAVIKRRLGADMKVFTVSGGGFAERRARRCTRT